MSKRHIITLIIAVLVLSLAGQTLPKQKVLNFVNPGNRRLLKTANGNFYFFRSLPEKSMSLDVKGLDKIQLRSFAIESLKKPQVVITINKKSVTYDLALAEKLNGFDLYQPLELTIPDKTETITVLCYSRSVYFRAFYTIKPKPKAKVKLPSLQLVEHAGMIKIERDSKASDYYSFTPQQELRFNLNNNRKADVYVRARLLDATIPVFELYYKGKLINTYDFTIKRTTQYKATGVTSLSIGKKITLDMGNGEYVLKAKSNHMFFARPVVLKK
ncbi:MAG TPA: hypothetical protein PKI15_02130 [Candidatus Cloacimonadota bacterium]|nr:hypothetical protein [Candidatus Cloacimonadota bacterium]